MKNNYLDKVVDQIVSETRIDYDKEKLHTPFPDPLVSSSIYYIYPSSYFSHHCKEVYGLNDDEVNYVWDEYRNIIKDKIENNGL